jgi:hypothetical protein
MRFTTSIGLAASALLAAGLAAAQSECVDSFRYNSVAINLGSTDYVDVTGTFDREGESKLACVSDALDLATAELYTECWARWDSLHLSSLEYTATVPGTGVSQARCVQNCLWV